MRKFCTCPGRRRLGAKWERSGTKEGLRLPSWRFSTSRTRIALDVTSNIPNCSSLHANLTHALHTSRRARDRPHPLTDSPTPTTRITTGRRPAWLSQEPDSTRELDPLSFSYPAQYFAIRGKRSRYIASSRFERTRPASCGSSLRLPTRSGSVCAHNLTPLSLDTRIWRGIALTHHSTRTP